MIYFSSDDILNASKDKKIKNVYLLLYHYNLYNPTSINNKTVVKVHKILSSWGRNVTWNSMPNFSDGVVSSVEIVGNGWYNFSLNSEIDYLSSKNNYGLLIKSADESLRLLDYFYSSRKVGYSPVLVIQFESGNDSGQVIQIEASNFSDNLTFKTHFNELLSSYRKEVSFDPVAFSSGNSNFLVIQSILVPDAKVYFYPKFSFLEEEGVLYFGLKSYEWVIKFSSSVNVNNLTNRKITLFNQEYHFSPIPGEISTKKLVLYKNPIDEKFKLEEVYNRTIGQVRINIKIVGINEEAETPSATIMINNEVATVKKGDTITLGGLKVHVKDVSSLTVSLFISTETIILEDGEQVAKDFYYIDGTSVKIISSDSNISQIRIKITPAYINEILVIPKEKEEFILTQENTSGLIDPVFENMRWIFKGGQSFKSVNKTKIRIWKSNDNELSISFKSKAGIEYSTPFVKFENGKLLFKIWDSPLITDGNVVKKGEYFILGSGEYQHIFRLTAFRNSSSAQSIVVQDIGSGTSNEWGFDSNYRGTMVYDGKTYYFKAVPTSAANGSILFTKSDYNIPYYLTNKIYTVNDNSVGLYLSEKGASIRFEIKETTEYSKNQNYGGLISLYVNYTNGFSFALSGAGDFVAQNNSIIKFDDNHIAFTPFGTVIYYSEDSFVEFYVPKEEILYTTVLKNFSCYEEGEYLANGFKSCCEGLKLIRVSSYNNYSNYSNRCEFSIPGYYCTKCGDGVCKSPENQCNCPEDCANATTCTDSDGGKNYFELGVVSYNNNNFTDSCPDFSTLEEYYCKSNGVMGWEHYTCPNGSVCLHGACSLSNNCIGEGGSLGAVVPENNNVCCNGLKGISSSEFIQGRCQVLVGNRGYCTKCGDGVCKSPENQCNCPEDCANATTCTDSDGGKNYLVKGFINETSSGSGSWDFCLNNTTTLVEYFCENNVKKKEYYMCEYLGPTFVCKDGACVKSYCNDTDGGLNYYTKGKAGVVGSYKAFEDYCNYYSETNEYVLHEAYCAENGVPQFTLYVCPYGCNNGACLNRITPLRD